MLVLALSLLSSLADAARNCRLQTFPLPFGNYLPATPTPVDVTGLIHVRCRGNPNPGQPTFYSLHIDGGSSGDPANRFMLLAAQKLSYNVYKDLSRTQVWVTPIVQVITGGARFDQDHGIFGRVFANQDPTPGQYSDVLTVTLEF